VGLLALVSAVLAVMVVGLLRSHAVILRALHDAGITLDDGAGRSASGARGEPTSRPDPEQRRDPVPSARHGRIGAVDLMGVTPEGDAIAVAIVGGGRRTLLAFLSSGCLTCRDFWDAFADPSHRSVAGPDTQLVVVTRGADAESASTVAQLADPDLVVVMSSEGFEDYGVPVAPYFLVVDGTEDRVVAEGATSSFDQLASLLKKATADARPIARTRRELLGRPLLGGSSSDRAARERGE